MDGTYWDISNIRKPIVALRERDLNEAVATSGTNRAFYLYAWFDNNGSIRVDDLAAISEDDRESLQALYDYIAGKTKTSMEEVVNQSDFIKNCVVDPSDSNKCSIGDNTYTKINLNSAIGRYCADGIFDYETSEFTCTDEVILSTATPGEYYFSEATGDIYNTSEYKGDGETTWDAANNYCKSQKAHVATAGELAALYNNEAIRSSGYSRYYWTAETLSSSDAFAINSSYSTNEMWAMYKDDNLNDNDIRVICIGN